jgi:hypothetical protein
LRPTRSGSSSWRSPGHPLLTPGSRNLVPEHRIVLYEAIGPGSHPCTWCGRLVNWEPGTQIGPPVTGERSDKPRTQPPAYGSKPARW